MINLVIHEVGHISVFLLLVLIMCLINVSFVSVRGVFLGLLATILIDLDHLVDYFLYKGSFDFIPSEFLRGDQFDYNVETYVPLHGWEYVALLIFVYAVLRDKKRYLWLLYITIGVFAHLLFDTVAYNFDPFFYLVSYRLFLMR